MKTKTIAVIGIGAAMITILCGALGFLDWSIIGPIIALLLGSTTIIIEALKKESN